MAEVLLRHHLAVRGVEASVSSAGVHEGGAPATHHGVAAMAARGLDLHGHVSRQVTRGMVKEADLIIGMAREHVREAAVLDPAVLERSFTLKDLVRRGEDLGPRSASEPLGDWLARMAASRQRSELVGGGHDPAVDVEDPVGRGTADYEATATLLDELLRRLVDLTCPADESADTPR